MLTPPTQAILKTTAKYLKSHGQMDADYLVKYCSSVANCTRHRD
jgi:hypothetical protein